jgi:ubiquinone/menaquinone biosynthesis C-methylase UbiE
MNYKMLLPSYRTRYQSVLATLDEMQSAEPLAARARVLHMGCGEGDFGIDVSNRVGELHSRDVNADDVAFSRKLVDGPTVFYAVADGRSLPYADDSFDAVLCIDVIHYTGSVRSVLAESNRFLKPGGSAIVSFPSNRFPVLYDPLNKMLEPFGRTVYGIGAYAYGSRRLLGDDEFEDRAAAANSAIVRQRRLSGELIGLLECDWCGLVQRIVKVNAGNQGVESNQRGLLRPGSGNPPFVGWVDTLIRVDAALCRGANRSIGRMYLLRKHDEC